MFGRFGMILTAWLACLARWDILSISSMLTWTISSGKVGRFEEPQFSNIQFMSSFFENLLELLVFLALTFIALKLSLCWGLGVTSTDLVSAKPQDSFPVCLYSHLILYLASVPFPLAAIIPPEVAPHFVRHPMP
jgi:hypothetical protein